MSDSRAYLAARVLNDRDIASYRSLSRELNIHVNHAKKLLYEFYNQENSKVPSSVYATYLVSGKQYIPDESTAINQIHGDGEDAVMQSSPFMSSPVPLQDRGEDQAFINVITLAGEGDLEEIKGQYDEIFSVHIYSLGPSPIKNLQILSDCNRAIAAQNAVKDPLEANREYGVIQNIRVKRRTKRPQILASASSNTSQRQKPIISDSQDTTPLNVVKSQSPNEDSVSKPEISSAKRVNVSSQISKKPEKRATIRGSAIKREQPDIFKAFSKPMPKLNHENTDSSATGIAPTATGLSEDESNDQVDEHMKDSSDDEQAEEAIEIQKQFATSSRSRSQREEQLRQMMEDEEKPVQNMERDAINQSTDSQEIASTEGTESPGEPAIKPQPIASGGRRRGRRKVLRKKTMKDDEGYLVTKEEVAWESFSEEEPVAKNITPTSSAGKVQKSSGKPSQGKIMSFFGKKKTG